MVRIYKLPDFVSGSGPTMSIDIFSKAAGGVSVITIGFFILTNIYLYIFSEKFLANSAMSFCAAFMAS